MACWACGFTLFAQEKTVGTILDRSAEESYYLFAPLNHRSTYLINRQGQVVNTWESVYVPGLSAYLSEDGQLYRAGRVTDSTHINTGGAGGIIERFDWDGNLTWQYHYASRAVRQHHDFELMPNGNLLLIAWEARSKAEAIEYGRDPSTMGGDQLWPDHIVEVKPTGQNEGEIVWEWHVWDHMIQDYDPSKLGYGIVADHPELIDINYRENISNDWIHGNSIEYNELLDQIAFSSRAFSEVWIIDHSTTTKQAADHSGGLMNKGGDLLYRWGNVTAYQKGVEMDRRLFGQHGLHWSHDNDDPVGSLYIFNNGNKRPGKDFASVETLRLLVDSSGSYEQVDHEFIPRNASLSFVPEDTLEMFAPLFSGVERLNNGHLLVCVGPRGTFIEYDQQGEVVWKYTSPVTESGEILNQGESIGDHRASNNSVFSVAVYGPDFPGFSGVSLQGGDVLEGDVVTSTQALTDIGWHIYPNPVSETLKIDLPGPAKAVELIDMGGRTVVSGVAPCHLDVSHFRAGIYFLKSENFSQKIIITR